MSREQRDVEQDESSTGAKTVLKWIAGAAALIVLAGGGYYAWKSYRANPTDTETTFAAAPSTQPLSEEDEAFQADIGSTEEFDAEPVAVSAPAPRRIPRTEPAEEIIGVTPASVTTTSGTESDEIVVPGRRRPNWSRVPSARRLSAMYPARALERGREGEASLRCFVEEDGGLDCTRVSETPENAGFGVAAMRVARTFRHAPERGDGSDATGTPVNLRILFRLEEDRRRR